MQVGIMQPYFFPYIGYWQLLNVVDEYIVFDDVNYIKRGWINRNNILLNGQGRLINLHIKDASQNRLIKDTQIAQTVENNRKLLGTITQSYRYAPYYEDVYALIERILNDKSTCVSDYLVNQLKEICTYLHIRTRVVLSSNIEKDSALKGEEKIIDICKKRKADKYINAIGGKSLYHPEKFKEQGIELKFLKTREIEYKQFGETFTPNLSIIDVMMFNDVDRTKEMLCEFDLEEGT